MRHHCLLVVAAIALGGCAASSDHTIRAQRFELVDAQGNVRAEIAIDDDGAAGFFVRDDTGVLRASLTYDESQSAMYLWDEAGHIRVGASFFAHGGAGVAVHGEGNKGGAVLYYKSGGSVTFFDEDGVVVHREPPAPPE